MKWGMNVCVGKEEKSEANKEFQGWKNGEKEGKNNDTFIRLLIIIKETSNCYLDEKGGKGDFCVWICGYMDRCVNFAIACETKDM